MSRTNRASKSTSTRWSALAWLPLQESLTRAVPTATPPRTTQCWRSMTSGSSTVSTRSYRITEVRSRTSHGTREKAVVRPIKARSSTSLVCPFLSLRRWTRLTPILRVIKTRRVSLATPNRMSPTGSKRPTMQSVSSQLTTFWIKTCRRNSFKTSSLMSSRSRTSLLLLKSHSVMPMSSKRTCNKAMVFRTAKSIWMTKHSLTSGALPSRKKAEKRRTKAAKMTSVPTTVLIFHKLAPSD